MQSHDKFKKHKCEECGRKFKRPYGLKQHLLTHDKQNGPVHKCNLCPKAFSRSDKLLRHRRTHGIPLNYHCRFCQRGFISQKSFLLHEASHIKRT